jgi:hypothetical protein
MSATLTALRDWDNFYVILGSSAAGLTGLTFVVITLAPNTRGVQLAGLRAFLTPITMHFGSVLGLSALLCIPGQTRWSLCLCMIGAGGMLSVYGAMTGYRLYRMSGEYVPVAEDWIWNAILPTCCSLLLMVAGIRALTHPEGALYLIGAMTLALLFIGIHNVWDLAVFFTTRRPAKPD